MIQLARFGIEHYEKEPAGNGGCSTIQRIYSFTDNLTKERAERNVSLRFHFSDM